MNLENPRQDCSLCGGSLVRKESLYTLRLKHKSLQRYKDEVCRKCYYGLVRRRQLAFLIDTIFLDISKGLGIYLGSSGHIISISMFSFFNLGDSYAPPAITAVVILLFLIKDGFNGYSPGKLICGLQVVDIKSRKPIGFQASLKRNIVLLIPFVPFLVAFMLECGEASRIGDGWAKTIVIWKKHSHSKFFDWPLE